MRLKRLLKLRKKIPGFIVLGALFLAFAPIARATKAPGQASAPVPGDRWMEIDLYWFEQKDLANSVHQFWDRFTPLYRGVQGDKGLILNVGWTVSYIMEFNGELSQQITLPQGKGEQPWVSETTALPGDTAARQAEWKQRFAKSIMVPHKGYGYWSYGDLKKLIVLLKAEAERRGIHDFKVGSLVYAWDNAYGEVPPWATKHPEAFEPVVPAHGHSFEIKRYFDPEHHLHADATKLGGLPHGIEEGMAVHAAFAAQWGSLSRMTGLDAIMLRDSFGFPVPYARLGRMGPHMQPTQAIHDATASVAALVRETKQSNPKALVMMYSNAASAIGDWRSNGCDLEQIAHEGYLDVFVDQTWAGAWNEVGVRHNNFWNVPTLGWTYQLAYMLMHRAMFAGTKVRHYPLVETFDAWESWDVLHTVPERLRWGIWAYSHAGLKTPTGVEMPKGSYISWANQGKRLLAPEDVMFLSTNISAAVRDAAQTREVYGPTLVYSRAAMQWQIDHADDKDIKEWIDEQFGTAMKWPLPILSVTRVEWIDKVHSDLPIVQTPSHLSEADELSLYRRVHDGKPTAIVGSFADGIDPQLLQLGDVGSFTPAEPTATIHQAQLGFTDGLHIENFPAQFPVKALMNDGAEPRRAAHAVYSIDESPQLILVKRNDRKLMLWDPPEFSKICCGPLSSILGGSGSATGASYALAAASANALLRDEHALHAKSIDLEQTGSVAAWKTADGNVHLLFGNLEEGLREDADQSRHIAMEFPTGWDHLHWHSLWTQGATTFDSADDGVEVHLAPDSSLQLEAPAK